MPLSAGDYRPRDAEHAVLYRVIDEHLDAFLETVHTAVSGRLSPKYRVVRRCSFSMVLRSRRELSHCRRRRQQLEHDYWAADIEVQVVVCEVGFDFIRKRVAVPVPRNFQADLE